MIKLLLLLAAALATLVFGLAGGLTVLGIILTVNLGGYRRTYLGEADERGAFLRMVRQTKFALFGPSFSITLALALVALASLFLTPLRIRGDLPDPDLAAQISAVEQRLYEVHQTLSGLLDWRLFLLGTAVLLLLNLIWPRLPLLAQAPRLRAAGSNLLLFLATLTTFTYVSGTTIARNADQRLASLKASLRQDQARTHHLQAGATSFWVMERSIRNLSGAEFAQLRKVLTVCSGAQEAGQVAKALGRETGQELLTVTAADSAPSGGRSALQSADHLDEIHDLTELSELRAKSLRQTGRMRLLHQAARESFLGSLDELSGKLLGNLFDGASAALHRVVLKAFFSGMVESVGSHCYDLVKTLKQVPGEAAPDLPKLFAQSTRAAPERFLGAWLEDLPKSPDPKLLDTAFAQRIKQLDADAVRLKSLNAAKAAKAAAQADEAAKAAKSAGKILRILL